LATNTKEAASNVGQNIKDYFVGSESTVIPDTISGVGTGMIMSQFQEEPEMSGGFIAPQPVQVQAQGAYMQEVGPMMASVTGVPNFSNFTQMANQNVYGIGTPNHLAGLYG
jgi:Tfp pilus assembly protein PilO